MNLSHSRTYLLERTQKISSKSIQPFSRRSLTYTWADDLHILRWEKIIERPYVVTKLIQTSVRVDKGSPGRRIETLASTRSAPSSIRPVHAPRCCTINTNSLTKAAASSPSFKAETYSLEFFIARYPLYGYLAPS